MDFKYKGVTMDYSYIGLINRILLMSKQTPITSIPTTVNSMGYKAALAVNDVIRDLSGILKIKTRETPFTFDTVASQRTYVLQKRIIYPFKNLRQKSTDEPINQMSAVEFDNFVPDPSGTGTPNLYYFEGFSGVKEQPAAAGETVYAVSDSGSDTGTVVVQGYDDNDNYVSDEITLTGTTAVASTSTFKKIDSVSKASTTGTVTFRNLGSTTTYETLSPKETASRRLTIGLHEIPSSAITIYGRGWTRLPDLVNEYDVPAGLTEDHINAIKFGAFAHFMEFDPKTPSRQIDGYYQRYYDEVTKITAVDKMSDAQPRMQGPSAARMLSRGPRALSRRLP